MFARTCKAIATAAAIFFLPVQEGSLSAEAVTENVGSGSPLPLNIRADSLVIDKGDRTMRLYSGGAVVKRYAIALGFEPVGPKRRQGDGRTPEGRYTISGRNPESIYHLSLRISYPDVEDIRRARKAGLNPGGDIFIHGWPDSVAEKNASPPAGDWTRGCIAVTNAEIEELWRAVPVGTPVVIYP